MADNREKIAEIDEIIASGVKSSSVDGTSVHHDLKALRKREMLYREQDELLRRTRPRVASINLGGLFEE
jgi:hypothetical protein